MKNDDHRSCVEHQGHGMYVWKKQILTSIIIEDAWKNNKRISLYHAHFFLPCSIFCACFLPVSLSFYFIVAVLMRKCWGQHSFPHSYSHTECYLLLLRNEMVLADWQKIRL